MEVLVHFLKLRKFQNAKAEIFKLGCQLIAVPKRAGGGITIPGYSAVV